MRYGVYKVLVSLLVVTLTFELLKPKANQYIYEPKYICDQNWAKFDLLFFEIRCSQGFRVIAYIHTSLHTYILL